MKFLNKNTFFTIEQNNSLDQLLTDLNGGVYNKFLNKNIRKNYSVLDIGYRSGYFLYKCAQRNMGDLYGIDNSNSLPSAKETFKFNNIQIKQLFNTTDVVSTVTKFLEENTVDIVVNSFYKDLNDKIKKILEDGKKNTLLFTFNNQDTYEILYKPETMEKKNEPMVLATAEGNKDSEQKITKKPKLDIEKTEEYKDEVSKEIKPKRKRRTRKAKTTE